MISFLDYFPCILNTLYTATKQSAPPFQPNFDIRSPWPPSISIFRLLLPTGILSSRRVYNSHSGNPVMYHYDVRQSHNYRHLAHAIDDSFFPRPVEERDAEPSTDRRVYKYRCPAQLLLGHFGHSYHPATAFPRDISSKTP